MRQVILKASFDLGWASSDYRVSLDGWGDTGTFVSFPDTAKVVVPVAGTFRHFRIYSPAGAHPNYTATVMVNGVATALTCALTAAQTTSVDDVHSATVVAGDDVYLSVNVSPFGSGTGYPMAVSLEFDGAAQWYGVGSLGGSHTSGQYHGGGALGNGVLQTAYAPNARSNTYSIATTSGVVTGLRAKTYAGAPGAGVYTAYLSKNAVLQDGTGGTVNTACVLTGTNLQATSAFALPVALGDHLDLALLYTGTAPPFALANVAVSVTFTPADTQTWMNCGGNNDANSATAVDWKWVQSQQLSASEAVAQCPVSGLGFVASGVYVEVPTAPGAGKSRVFTLRKNGIDTGATCTISGTTALTCQITGLAIPFADGDLIDLQVTPVGAPSVTNGLHWGLAFAPPPPIPPPPPASIDPIRRLRQAPHLWDGASGHRLKYPGFQLLVEAGAPRDTDGPMSWVLQWSDDGGHSWSHEHRIAGSRLGEHTFRFWWRRLGQSRDRVFRVVNSDDCKIVVVDALLVPDPVEGSS